MKNFRFPKRIRLLSKVDFDFAERNKINHKYLLLLHRPNKKPHARLGAVVGKRNVPNASDRNQIKRVIRESFRINQHRLPAVDVIIIARQQCDKVSPASLREGLDQLWQKLIIQCQKSSSA